MHIISMDLVPFTIIFTYKKYSLINKKKYYKEQMQGEKLMFLEPF